MNQNPSEIPTWEERCDDGRFSDMHIVTNADIQGVMQEEIDALRHDLERAMEVNAELATLLAAAPSAPAERRKGERPQTAAECLASALAESTDRRKPNAAPPGPQQEDSSGVVESRTGGRPKARNESGSDTAPAVAAPSGAGDWTEDFPHENGNYQNRCTDCGQLFLGHKRRMICKQCSGAGETPLTDDAAFDVPRDMPNFDATDVVDADFARSLERALVQAREALLASNRERREVAAAIDKLKGGT
jgi:hypothetical protein